MRQTSLRRRALALVGIAAASALALTGCSGSASNDSGSGSDSSAKSVKVGISQLVQHPALDAATKGFKQALEDSGMKVTFDEQNAQGDQANAVTIAQKFASSDADLYLAVATPAAQALAQAVTNKPVLFTAVTDAVTTQLVKSNEQPGGNVTGTSDAAPIDKQLELLKQIVPGAKTVGIVYSSAEANSEVQVKAAQEAGKKQGLTFKTKTVTTANDIAQATESLGDVDAIYVPTDNTVVSGLAALVQVAEKKQIPVIGAEAGTVEKGAVATLGIDYEKLGYQTGEMAVQILKDGKKPADLPVETAKDVNYVVNEGAAKRMGVTIPADILDKAEKVK